MPLTIRYSGGRHQNKNSRRSNHWPAVKIELTRYMAAADCGESPLLMKPQLRVSPLLSFGSNMNDRHDLCTTESMITIKKKLRERGRDS